MKDMLLAGPLMLAEVRGFKAEIGKRFDKSDKNAEPLEFGVIKFQLELLGDGTPFLLTVFLDPGTKPETYAASIAARKGDRIAIAVRKLEQKGGFCRASCSPGGFRVLNKEELKSFLQ